MRILSKMKMKLICLLLAVIQLPLAAFGNTGSVNLNSAYVPCCEELLSKLKIITYNSEFNEKTVSKGEFIRHALLLIGASAENKSGEIRQIFADVPVSSEYAADVETAYTLGILKGGDSGVCGINSAVSLADAAVLMVRAIGMNAAAQESGGYPSGFMAVAARYGILKGVSVERDTDLTYAMLSQMLYNALFCPAVKSTGYTQSGGSVTIDENSSILSGVHKVQFLDGVVESNANGSIFGNSSESSERVIVDGTYFASESDISDKFLGMRIRAYYKTEKSGALPMLIFMEDRGYNKTVKVRRENVISYKAGELRCYGDNGNEIKHSVSEKAITVCCGEMKTVTAEEYAFPDNCKITLIDNDGDFKADVVFIDEYTLIKVKRVNTEERTIYNGFKTGINLDLKDYRRTVIKNGEEKDIELTELKENDIIEAFLGEDKVVARLNVITNPVSITVKNVRKKTENARTIYIISTKNGETYRTGYSFDKDNGGEEIKTDSAYTALLDSEGRIAALTDKTDTNALIYGYVCAYGKERNTLKDVVKIKIYTENGDFTAAESEKNVYSENLGKKITNAELLTYLADASVIRFRIDEKNILRSIEFPSTNVSGKGLKVVGASETSRSAEYRWYQTGMVLGGKVLADKKTKVMIVPEREKLATDEDLFSVESIGYFKNDAYYPGVVGYGTDDNGYLADIMVVQNPTGTALNSVCMLVSGIGSVYDKTTGEIRTSISGFVKGEEKEYVLAKYMNPEYKAKNIETPIPIEEGDAIRINYNFKNEINYLKLMFDESEKTIYGVNDSTDDEVQYGNGGYHTYGTVSEKYANTFKVIRTGHSEASNNIYPVTSTTYIYEYNESAKDKNRVRLISIDDIVAKNESADSASRVFIYMYKPPIEMIVVYK